MHAKTDSDATSVTHSSPPRSPPRRPAYYVQSPSRDSHDFEKATTNTNTSFHSTPAVLSPNGSPPHSNHSSSVGHHSRESSSTRFSGSLKPTNNSRSKINPNNNDPAATTHHHRNKSLKPWGGRKGGRFDVIEEEGLLDDEQDEKRHTKRCYILAFVFGFLLLFTLFSLILYGASKPMKPKITVKTIQFDHVGIQAGSDNSGVATDMITINSTVKLIYRNTATFFGVHVTSTPVDLTYSDLTVASGTIKKFYQSRKSQRTLSINVKGTRLPLYGGGAHLSSATGTLTSPVNVTLSFTVRSRGYVLGKLVKPKFYKKVNCDVTLDPKKLGTAVSLLKKSCTYK